MATPPRKRKVNPQEIKPTPLSVKLAEEFHTGMPQDPGYEEVVHPQHYNNLPNGIECWDVNEHFNANLGAAIKYIWRAGLKPGVDKTKDLKKVLQYVQREIDRIDGNVPKMGVK